MQNLNRTRWAAIGAAVAISLGAGGISLTHAAISSGNKPVFVSITPCRLIDTRGAVGPRSTPLTANETIDLQITGSVGQCSGIPGDAVGAALNVTAIAGTAQSFLTVYPADAALPNASNLNWRAGDGPTPNKVDVKLSATGAVKMTNAFGTVHVAADLVGYYIDHNHDDRYYTEGEVDSAIGAVESNLATVASDVNNATRVHFARVAANGTVEKTSNQAITVVKNATGSYTVTLPESAANCAVQTTLHGRAAGLGYLILGAAYSLEAYSFSIHDTAGPANEVDVFTRIYDDAAGDQLAVASDLPFAVTAYCSNPIFIFIPGITIPPIISP